MRAGLLKLSQAWEILREEEYPNAELEVCNALRNLAGPKMIASSNMMYFIMKMMLDPPKEVMDGGLGVAEAGPHCTENPSVMHSTTSEQNMKRKESLQPRNRKGLKSKQWYLQPVQVEGVRFGSLKSSNPSRQAGMSRTDRYRLDRTRLDGSEEYE